ncbi:MAG: hypothetical protein OXC93_08575 [Rhodospirillaceae bacterium]|nr:hypothetical protein [Rhodospirillaceae bacterium]
MDTGLVLKRDNTARGGRISHRAKSGIVERSHAGSTRDHGSLAELVSKYFPQIRQGDTGDPNWLSRKDRTRVLFPAPLGYDRRDDGGRLTGGADDRGVVDVWAAYSIRYTLIMKNRIAPGPGPHDLLLEGAEQ